MLVLKSFSMTFSWNNDKLLTEIRPPSPIMKRREPTDAATPPSPDQQQERKAELAKRIQKIEADIEELCAQVRILGKDEGGIKHITNNILPVASVALETGKLDRVEPRLAAVETFLALLKRHPKILDQITTEGGIEAAYPGLGQAAYDEGVKTARSNAIVYIEMLKNLVEPKD